jgi:hypothetical protein
MKSILVLILFGTTLLAACKKDDQRGGIFKGPKASFLDGKAWTWLQLDKWGRPEKIAVAIDDAALSSLDGAGSPGHIDLNNVSLKFHPMAATTLFRHVWLNWHPQGHEPPGIYDLPHFDFHFYLQTDAERSAIPDYATDSAKFNNFPAPAYLPEHYIPTPGGDAQMGKHWVDVTSPEFNGQIFTQTVIYGTYDGRFTFFEAMITKAFLDAHPAFERTFPVAARFQVSGYYPTRLRVLKEKGVLNVILEGFVYRRAS